MLKIRLTRFGKHKVPCYRIITIDSRKRRDGEYIEWIGTYDPLKSAVELKEDRILFYLKNGAQPSETVRSLLKKQGIWKTFTESKK